MCCFFTVLVFLGPRAAILVWWLISTARWQAAFDSFIWPLLGFIFAPWTTLAWVAVWSPAGLQWFDWVILGLAIVVDVLSWGSGPLARRRTAYA